jgi:hypothetical protein
MHQIEKNYHIFLPSYNSINSKINVLLDKCNLHDNFIFVVKYAKYTNYNFFKKEVIREQKEILTHYKDHCNKNNLKLKILIDANVEAPSYRDDLTKYCDFLIELLDIPLSHIIIFGEAEHQHGDNVNFVICNIPTILNEMFEESASDLLPSHHFVSLARVAKPHRLYCTTQMIDKNLIQFGKVSLGSGFHHTNGENGILNFLPEQHKKLIPMIVDSKFEGGNDNTFFGSHPSIQLAFINLVQESAFDTSLQFKILDIYNITENSVGTFNWKNLTNKGHLSWQVNSFTEKSMKPFVWGQVPLFNTIYDNLKYIRKLGFDLFDDIIDHSYDAIEDPIARIDAVVVQLQKICQWSIDECRDYKKQNMARFIKNREIAQELHDYKFEQMALNNLQKIIDKY